MRDKIHPKYGKCVVTCSCGNNFITSSTRPKIQVEICSNCHPFYTGKKKLVDDAGRVERFAKMMAKTKKMKQKKQGKKKSSTPKKTSKKTKKKK